MSCEQGPPVSKGSQNGTLNSIENLETKANQSIQQADRNGHMGLSRVKRSGLQQVLSLAAKIQIKRCLLPTLEYLVQIQAPGPDSNFLPPMWKPQAVFPDVGFGLTQSGCCEGRKPADGSSTTRLS